MDRLKRFHASHPSPPIPLGRSALTRVAVVRGLNRYQPVRAFVPKVRSYYALG
jgi:hypothetical protein